LRFDDGDFGLCIGLRGRRIIVISKCRRVYGRDGKILRLSRRDRPRDEGHKMNTLTCSSRNTQYTAAYWLTHEGAGHWLGVGQTIDRYMNRRSRYICNLAVLIVPLAGAHSTLYSLSVDAWISVHPCSKQHSLQYFQTLMVEQSPLNILHSM